MYKEAGAIPLVRSTTPQALLSLNSLNPIWGQAKNPFQQGRVVGGSSGGCGGQMGSRCVPISIGADGGGSLRFPAAFCGIYVFKPTQTRLSGKGLVHAQKNGFSLFDKFPHCFGPYGKSVQDLVT